MITTPIFTRIMSTEEYGRFGVFNSWLGIITIIVSLNLFYGVHTQGLVKFSENSKEFTSSLHGLTTVLIAGWGIVYISLHNFWNQLLSLNTVQMISMLLIIWTTSIFNYWANEQRVTYSYKGLVIVTLLVSFLKPFLEIVFVLKAKDKVTARIIGWLLVEVLAYSWMYYYQLKKGKIFYSKIFWKYIVVFSLPLIPHYLSATVLNSADRIMIEKMVGSSESGIYTLAYSVALIMTLFNTALTQTITPWMYQKIKSKRENELAPIAYMTLIIVAVVNLLLILLAPEIIAIFAPKSYYEAIWVIPPVAMSVYFLFSYDLFAKFAFYYEKTVVIMIASVLGAVLNIILNYIFIKRYGYIAAGYTTLVCYMVFSVFHYIFMKKICYVHCEGVFPYNTKRIILITVPFLLLGFAALAVYNMPIIRYGILFILLVLVFVFRKKILWLAKSLINLRAQ